MQNWHDGHRSQNTSIDLSVVEYVKMISCNKYYKDKLKTVLCSFIYVRKYQKLNNSIKFVPSMLISRLKGEVLLIHQTDRNWLLVDIIAEVNVPDNIDLLRNGAIEDNINSLKIFKLS